MTNLNYNVNNCNICDKILSLDHENINSHGMYLFQCSNLGHIFEIRSNCDYDVMHVYIEFLCEKTTIEMHKSSIRVFVKNKKIIDKKINSTNEFPKIKNYEDMLNWIVLQ